MKEEKIGNWLVDKIKRIPTLAFPSAENDTAAAAVPWNRNDDESAASGCQSLLDAILFKAIFKCYLYSNQKQCIG